MVTIGIPKHYTTSPSSLNGTTPSLTINREATLDLDSSNAFEGKTCRTYISLDMADRHRS